MKHNFSPQKAEAMDYHEYLDYWVCKCKNFEKLDGFMACDRYGNLISPIGAEYCRCERCGRVIHVKSHRISAPIPTRKEEGLTEEINLNKFNMKALHLLIGAEKSKLLHDLFPDEIPALLENITEFCTDFRDRKEEHRPHWKDGFMSFDYWQNLSEETAGLLQKHKFSMQGIFRPVVFHVHFAVCHRPHHQVCGKGQSK